jgi:SAM-dependent methyltransferase
MSERAPLADADALARAELALAASETTLPADPATEAWLAGPGARPHGPLVTAAQRVLRAFASDFDTNAWLGTHSLHLTGRAGFEHLLGCTPGAPLGGRLLDVGAGTGEVTAELAPLFDEVVTTEVSRGMARRLTQRGFTCLRVDLAEDVPPGLGRFRVVALLNVLDRATRPATLLDRALEHLEPGGRLLVASPLPMRPHVQGPGTTREPDEWIAGRAESFDLALAELVEVELARRGLSVERWARAPYRSQGDAGARIYELPSAILVARR